MEYKAISVIGLGLIGGSLAKSIKKVNPEIEIFALDKDEIVSQAKDDGIVSGKLNSIEDSLNSDIIFICLPVTASLEIFKKLIPKLKDGQTISDVCSVKNPFMKLWNNSGSKGIYIGGHPMTGKEKSGYENSDSILFENTVYILTNGKSKDERHSNFALLIESCGAHVTFLDADIHDMIVAEVSHLPQLIATSLVNTISEYKDFNILSFAAGGFRDMTRIASSPFSVWEPIVKQNKDKILNALKSFRNELDDIRNIISQDDYKLLAEKFESARIKRDVIPKNTKGFISRLYDVFIYVKDQPGEMSKISTALYQNNINIKDIEVLKIREGSGGSFRLSFATENDAKRAKQIIESIGFSTKI